MKAVAELTDDELRAELAKFGHNAPPVTGTTRTVLQKKLTTFRNNKAAPSLNKVPTPTPANKIPTTASPKIPAAASSTSKSSTTSSPIRMPITASPIKTPTAFTIRTSFGDIGFGSGTGTSTSSRPSFMNSFGDKSLFGNNEEEDDDDDHMESSRIISPKSRFRPSFGGTEGIRGRNLGQFDGSISSSNKPSPVEKFKNIGRTAWSFFSRPLGTSTPCSDTGYKYAGYTSAAANKYRRYSTGFGPGGMDAGKRGGSSISMLPTVSPDTSRLIGGGIVFFIALIVSAYIYQAHTEAVLTALGKGKDATVGVFNFLCKYAIFPAVYLVAAALIIFAIYKMYDYNRRSKIEENRRLIELVERVTDIIFESGSAGIAEPHVRDMLMPPTKRTESEYKRWQQAARFINNEDSRIRTEIRLIDGTECNVWIWMGAGKQRWQGTGQ